MAGWLRTWGEIVQGASFLMVHPGGREGWHTFEFHVEINVQRDAWTLRRWRFTGQFVVERSKFK